MIRLTYSIFLITLLLCGCSNSLSDPVTKSTEDPNADTPVFFDDDSESDRHLLGRWEMHFNSETNLIELECSRESEMHFNITHQIPFPIIDVNSSSVNFVACLNLNEPSPPSGFPHSI